jgi:hypothetical protein
LQCVVERPLMRLLFPFWIWSMNPDVPEIKNNLVAQSLRTFPHNANGLELQANELELQANRIFCQRLRRCRRLGRRVNCPVNWYCCCSGCCILSSPLLLKETLVDSALSPVHHD